MWNKTFAGLIGGIIFIIFTPSAFSLLFYQQIPLMLALTVVLGLSAWAGIMTWCYAAPNGKTAWLRSSYFILGSLAFYGLLFLTVGMPK
ncbi:hypothetical protein HF888_06985 [Bermanella marisrubri]|uniref:hypothetical protein n=1 Tax=Bermanella marisrubri TaxID=207949 RepID=UPI00058DDB33|nr:hypothetical protein [Bermanella marisrubri]QIZ83987.1 hypothetical protein HF888_06985 [Bermanella marisrubri]